MTSRDPQTGQAQYFDDTRQIEYIRPGTMNSNHKNNSIKNDPGVIRRGGSTELHLRQTKAMVQPLSFYVLSLSLSTAARVLLITAAMAPDASGTNETSRATASPWAVNMITPETRAV
jgi:hypothetical protein